MSAIPAKDDLLATLQKDQAQRWRDGRPKRVEEYLAEQSELAADREAVLDLICSEVWLRAEAGETPRLADYADRFPHLAAEIGPLCELAECTAGEAAGMEPSIAATIAAGSPAPVAIAAIRSEPGQNGRRFGDYLLLTEIARGGMGIVYRAQQISLDRLVALKVILAGRLGGREEIERFRNEAQAAAQLDHPGIVQVYEHGMSEGELYLAMPLVDGKSLAEAVREQPLEPKAAASIVRRAAEAVQYAHDRGVVHRDLKPGNILLTAEGQPRITDFGLAKRAGGNQLTATGDILGTPSYMPPEQALGKHDSVGAASDVYSLGATLYCLVTGRPPFQAADVMQTLRQVIEGEAVSPRELNPAVDVDLETICLRCLQKDPRQRYASASDLAADLGRFERSEPIVARPVGLAEHFWRWCGRHPWIAGLGGLAVGLLIAIAGVSTTAYFRENQLLGDKSKALEEVKSQKKTLEANQVELTSNYQAAQSLVRQYLTHLVYVSREDVRVEDREELVALRDEIRGVTQQYFKEFVVRGRSDADTSVLLAGALDHLGYICRELHDAKSALETYELAEKVLLPLQQKEPNNLDVRLSLAKIYAHHGNLLDDQGELEQGLVKHNQVAQLLLGLPAEMYDRQELFLLLTEVQMVRVRRHVERADVATARGLITELQQTFARRERHLLAAPDDANARFARAEFELLRGTIRSLDKDGEPQVDADNVQNARQHYVVALDLLDKVQEKGKPADYESFLKTRTEVLIALASMADYDDPARDEHATQAVAAGQELCAAYPRVGGYQYQLANALAMSATEWAIDGHYDTACADVQQIHDILATMPRTRPQFHGICRFLVTCEFLLTRIASDAANYGDALSHARRAQEAFFNLPPERRESLGITNFLPTTRRWIALYLTELGKYDEALKLLRSPEYRGLLSDASLALCQAGSPQECLAAVDQVKATLGPGRMPRLQAGVYARASAAVLAAPSLDTSERSSRSEMFAAQAVEILRQHVAGVSERTDRVNLNAIHYAFHDSPHFQSLRGRQDFQALRVDADRKLDALRPKSLENPVAP